jgi:tRNA dimethylallyltransferase
VKKNSLIVLLGPTGVGKTALSLRLAKTFGCAIVSADSRQVFRELKIGTAVPSEEQLAKVPHYFIGNKSITEHFSAGQYEAEALEILKKLFSENSVQMLVGGSMLYIDAVCKGLDDIPTVDAEVRKEVTALYNEQGLAALQQKLCEIDPVYYQTADLNNRQRIIHALEVCIATGNPYSNLLNHTRKERPFNIVKIGLTMDRKELYERINARVDQMLEQGLLEEARQFYPFKQLNSLKTVGYRELFDYFDGNSSLEFAVEKIKQNSRRYAKRQLTWFRADEEIQWFEPHQDNEIVAEIKKQLSL